MSLGKVRILYGERINQIGQVLEHVPDKLPVYSYGKLAGYTTTGEAKLLVQFADGTEAQYGLAEVNYDLEPPKQPTGWKVQALEPGEYVMDNASGDLVKRKEVEEKQSAPLREVQKSLLEYVRSAYGGASRSPSTRQEWREFLEPHIPYYETYEGFLAKLANVKPTSVDSLALALFRTDPEVLAYCKLRGEADVGRAVDVCWKLDDRGFKSRCMERAKAMHEVLK